LSREIEFKTRDKKTHRMTKERLACRNEAAGEEALVTEREKDLDLRAKTSDELSSSIKTARGAKTKPISAPGTPIQGPMPESNSRASPKPRRYAPKGSEARQSEKVRQRNSKYHLQFTPEAEKPPRPADAPDSEKPSKLSDAPNTEKPSKLNFAADELPPEPPGKK